MKWSALLSVHVVFQLSNDADCCVRENVKGRKRLRYYGASVCLFPALFSLTWLDNVYVIKHIYDVGGTTKTPACFWSIIVHAEVQLVQFVSFQMCLCEAFFETFVHIQRYVVVERVYACVSADEMECT